MNNDFYRLPVARISQGDIFRDVPSVYVPDPEIVIVRRRESARGSVGDLYTVGDEERQPQQAFNPNGDHFVGTVQLANAILLTHSCEVDNSPRSTVTFGLIRPIRLVPEDAREAIRAGRNLRLMYLPANDGPAFEESYVDFSRLTSVRREAVREDARVLSATDLLLKAIYLGLVRYVTRFEVSEDEIKPLVQQAMEEVHPHPGP